MSESTSTERLVEYAAVLKAHKELRGKYPLTDEDILDWLGECMERYLTETSLKISFGAMA
jgi:hypothetical protein